MIRYKLLFPFLALGFIVLFTTCEYEPDGVYNRKVNENPTPPELQIVDLNLPGDTIYLYTGRDLKFKFQSSDQKILSVSFQFDNEKPFTKGGQEGTFQLPHTGLSGSHKLKLEVYFRSGTGSIADSLEIEVFTYTREWVVKIMPKVNNTIETSVSNGFLKLRWPEYKGTDFKEFLISRVTSFYSSTIIKRVKTTEFIDSTYVGEGGTFDIDVLTDNSSRVSWGQVYVNPDLPKITITSNSQNLYTIKWNKATFYQAVDTSVLYLYSYYTNKYEVIKATTNYNDTLFYKGQETFGNNAFVYLRLVPRKGNVTYSTKKSYFEVSFEGRYGHFFTSQPYTYYIFNTYDNGFLFFEKYNSFVKYSLKDGVKSRILERNSPGCNYPLADPDISADGSYVGSHADCNKNLIFIRPSDNKVLLRVNPVESYSQELPISSNGIALVNKTQGGFLMYDFQNDKILAEYKKTSQNFTRGYARKISLNGDYMLVQDDSLRLLHYNNGTFQSVWSHTADVYPKAFYFSGTNPDELILLENDELTIRKCSDMTIVNQIPFNDYKLLNIDFRNNEFLSFAEGHLYVRSLADGTIKHDVPINFPAWEGAYLCYLVNHTIISVKGFLYHLN